MPANIAALLDKAKVMHRLPSDYKLALVMGIRTTSVTNYRTGKTLPDARVIRILCDLTGDDAALLAAEIEEQRASTDEARALWHQVAQRLQAAGVTAVLSVVFVLGGMGLSPNEAHAAVASNSQLTKLYIVEYQMKVRRSGDHKENTLPRQRVEPIT